MREPRYPALYQINTRAWLTERSRGLGRPATLDDIPDAELDRVAGMGLDWAWLLSMWRTGPAAVRALGEFVHLWPEAVRGLITGRFPIAGTPKLLTGRASRIKEVVAVGGRP